MSETAQSEPRTLKNGVKAHVFTDEDRRKGQAKSAETRRERAKTHGQRVRERIERKEKQLVDALTAKALEGNVQALQTLWAYAYGTPAKVEPDEMRLDVSQEPRKAVNLSEITALAASLGIEQSNGAEGSNHG